MSRAWTILLFYKLREIERHSFSQELTALPSRQGSDQSPSTPGLVFRPAIAHTHYQKTATAAMERRMDWKQLLAYITGSVEQELLLRDEYLVMKNRIA